MEFKVYDITPVPKPRQTQSASWKKRPCDERYYRFKDEIRFSGIRIPDSGYCVLFVLKMPKSWSKKKKRLMLHKPHQQRPDKDNLEKALLDAVFDKSSELKDDSHVWDGRCVKIWGNKSKIILITGSDTKWVEIFMKQQFGDDEI